MGMPATADAMQKTIPAHASIGFIAIFLGVFI
jgi:hypothetical protein